jgi:ABC-2 type transport system ATP-binding protein
MTDTNRVLTVSNLSNRIGKSPIIKDVSFELDRGEILGLLGPNGSGKTTILKMLVGLIKPNKGDIFIEGFHLSKEFEKAIAHVGAIIETPEMYEYLTGNDNLVHFFRMSEDFSYERMKEVIDLLDMQSYINNKVFTYSLGMKQRLGLAQAILHHPSVLLLDEPTNGLDPAGMKDLRMYLRKLADEYGVAIIISSHILAEVEMLCDSVMIIDDGVCIERAQINQIQEESGDIHTFSFELLNAQNIESILEGLHHIQLHSNGFTVELTPQGVADLNTFLVENKINVIGIERIGNPLEDLFLRKMERK